MKIVRALRIVVRCATYCGTAKEASARAEYEISAQDYTVGQEDIKEFKLLTEELHNALRSPVPDVV